jgi:hypothetical protein
VREAVGNAEDDMYGENDIRDSMFRLKLLGWRLRIRPGALVPWQHISTCYLEGNNVFVFVVSNNKAVTIEDDPNLFPSDQLISALRLLSEAK